MLGRRQQWTRAKGAGGEQGNAARASACADSIGDGQAEGERPVEVLMQEAEHDYIILEDSAHEEAAVVDSSMNKDDMELESDGATWQVVYRSV